MIPLYWWEIDGVFMNVEAIIPLVAAFVCIGIASYTDIKRHEIPDKLPYIMVLLGLSISAVIGASSGDLTLPLLSMTAGAMAFVIGLIFWKIGVWAGGDAKFYAGLVVIVPTLGFLGLPLFPLALLLVSMSAFIMYTFIHTIYYTARKVDARTRLVKVGKLEGGMVPAEYVYMAGMEVHRASRDGWCPKATAIYADPKSMEGLTAKQIEKLKEVLGKDSVLRVRRTHAFIPFFLVGLIVVIFWVI